MKKLVAAVLTSAALTSAQAVDLSVYGVHTLDPSNTGYGIELGHAMGQWRVGLSAESVEVGRNNVESYFSTVSYDVYKLGVLTVSAQVGGGYVRQEVGSNGWAATVGAGAALAFTKNTSAVLDVRHQLGQNKIDSLDGSSVTLGVRYSF